MKPILFYIGAFPIFSFGFMVALGVLISLYLMNRRARRTGFPPGEGAFDMVFVVVVSGFLGGRLYYVLQNKDWYLNHPLKFFALWEGGLVFYGGLISAFLGLWLFFYVKKFSLARGLDFILPYVALSHAFGRVGCFLNGCCYGKVCNYFWAVRFPELPYSVHPTQLYESLFDFLLFFFLNQLYEKKEFKGQVSALYFFLYAVGRFVVEQFRDDNPFWGILTVNQWLSLAIAAAASFFYFRLKGQALTSHEQPSV